MGSSILMGLLQNIAILLLFTMLYENFWVKNKAYKSLGSQVLVGFILSGIGVVLMCSPWHMGPGMAFDTRSVMLSISGLFFGFIPTVITMFAMTFLRIVMGGDGVWMGTTIIITSGTIGLLWRSLRPSWRKGRYYLELLSMGVVVHLVMALCVLLLPPDKMVYTLKTIALPLLFLYTPATVLIGSLMLRQYFNVQNRTAMHRLEELERKFIKVLDSGNIVSLLLDVDGRVKYCNKYLLDITGFSQEEVMNHNWFKEFLPDNVKLKIYQIYTDCIVNKRIDSNVENEILTKDGRIIYISWYNNIFFTEKGEIDGIASIGVDVTERKRYEKMLKEKNQEYRQINIKLKKAKEKAEESDRLKSAFLANMSHEIRTPMNGILGFADLLKSPDLSPEKQQQYIEIIEKSGLRMLNLINDLIEISKIEAGVVLLHKEQVKVRDAIYYVDTFFRPQIQAKGIEFRSSISIQDDLVIVTDREKLLSVLTNLLKNALKFTLSGYIELTCCVKENFLYCCVKDTGVGIPADKLDAVFDRFMQADPEDKMARQGAGLGLAISKAFVEKLGGKISVNSVEGAGSEFCFTIPLS